MALYSRLCRMGEKTCKPVPAISRVFQNEVIFRYLIPWLDSTLKGNVKSALFLKENVCNDPAVEFRQK